MNILKVQRLLYLLAQNYTQETKKFSKEDLFKRIKELKYLSTQKHIPKLTLRKGLVHLEQQIQGLYELEKTLVKMKSHESVKIKSLKMENARLKKKIAALGGHKVEKKVGKLSHLLGDYLAQKETSQNIAALQMEKMIKPMPEPSFSLAAEQKQMQMMPKPRKENSKARYRLEQIKQRIEALKNELLIHQERETHNPEKIRLILQSITSLETALKFYSKSISGSMPSEIVTKASVQQNKDDAGQEKDVQQDMDDAGQEKDVQQDMDDAGQEKDIQQGEMKILPYPGEIKHKVLFDVPPVQDIEKHLDLSMEKELPIPPPPKMEKKEIKF